jgi:hypothetical protein
MEPLHSSVLQRYPCRARGSSWGNSQVESHSKLSGLKTSVSSLSKYSLNVQMKQPFQCLCELPFLSSSLTSRTLRRTRPERKLQAGNEREVPESRKQWALSL